MALHRLTPDEGAHRSPIQNNPVKAFKENVIDQIIPDIKSVAYAFNDSPLALNKVVNDAYSRFRESDFYQDNYVEDPVLKVLDNVDVGPFNNGSSVGPTSASAVSRGDTGSDIVNTIGNILDEPKTPGQIANAQAISNTNTANLYNSNMMSDIMEWYERMSNTAVQRAYADAKAAGINPILYFASGGSPASTPAISPAYTSASSVFKDDTTIADQIVQIARTIFDLITGITGSKKY